VLFEIEISGEPGAYQVEVLHSGGGGRPRERLVLDPAGILSHRTELENAVLASSVQSRRIVPTAEEPLRMVGQQLFEALFTGHVYGAYRASLGAAQQQQKRLGVVLRIVEPELAALPWEALFDPEIEEYLCRSEPLIRHVDAPYTAEPLEVCPPLRILGLVASPRGLPILDVAAERQHLEQALAKPWPSRRPPGWWNWRGPRTSAGKASMSRCSATRGTFCTSSGTATTTSSARKVSSPWSGRMGART
jgi:hypothetical protein